MFAARNAFLTAAAATAPDTGTARASIVLPNPGRVVYPILPVLRQAMQGGKTPQRLSAADDPTKGAMTSIVLPNPTSLVYPVLGALRQPRTGQGVLVAASPVTPVATGAGTQVNGSPMTWTDTIPANADYAVLWVINRTSVASPTIAATIGGAGATLVSTLFNPASSGFFDNLLCYVLQRPPTGPSQTISFTTTNLLGVGGTIEYYRNVTSIGSAITAAAANSSATMSTPSSPNCMYSQAFSFIASALSQGFSAYNQTQRASQVAFTNIEPMIVGDAVGNGATLTFSATAGTATGWCGTLLPLL